MENKKYYVKMKVVGRFVAEVTASDIEEAKRKAEEQYQDADFGPLEDIESEPVVIEDENGDYLWEK